MKSPLQQKVYELVLRIVSLEIPDAQDERIKNIRRELFNTAMQFGLDMENASASSDRFEFGVAMYHVLSTAKQLKFTLKVLDDLGYMDPDQAYPIGELSEECFRLILAAIKTSEKNGNKEEQQPKSLN